MPGSDLRERRQRINERDLCLLLNAFTDAVDSVEGFHASAVSDHLPTLRSSAHRHP